MATAISLGHIKVYRTSRSTHWLYGGLVIFLSATEIWSVIEIWSWLHAGPAPRQPVATLIFALCVPFLIVLFVKSMRARLIITAEGIARRRASPPIGKLEKPRSVRSDRQAGQVWAGPPWLRPSHQFGPPESARGNVRDFGYFRHPDGNLGCGDQRRAGRGAWSFRCGNCGARDGTAVKRCALVIAAQLSEHLQYDLPQLRQMHRHGPHKRRSTNSSHAPWPERQPVVHVM